jgi:hypothetical protein
LKQEVRIGHGRKLETAARSAMWADRAHARPISHGPTDLAIDPKRVARSVGLRAVVANREVS